MRTIFHTAAAVVTLALPSLASAQVGNPVPQALAMGGNYTAIARGFAAPAWNPAGLGMPDNPGFSITFLPVNGTLGLSPISPTDLTPYDGQIIPDEVKREWLATIQDNDGEIGDIGADVTYLAFSAGHVAFSASSSLRGRVNVAPDVAELLFFGNAGLTGEPGDYSLAGSQFDAAVTTTFAGSFAAPFSLTLGPLPDQHFALGVTLTYTIGNVLMLGKENGSSITSDPVALNINFPVINTPLPDSAGDVPMDDILNNGSGFGVDVGAAWQAGIFSAGLVIRNLVNTFEWDTSGLQFRSGTAVWDADTSYTSFESRDIADAPTELTDRINELYTFSPIVVAGAAAHVLPFLTVTGEVRHALEDNLQVGAQNHAGIGAELTIIPILPLWAGVSVISGGYQLSGGLGLKLGPARLSAAGALRQADLGDVMVGALGLTFGLR